MNTAPSSTNFKRVQPFKHSVAQSSTNSASFYKNNQFQNNLIRPQPLRLQEHPIQTNNGNTPAAKHLARLLMQASQLIRGGAAAGSLPTQVLSMQASQQVKNANKRPTIMVHSNHNTNSVHSKILNFKFTKENVLPSSSSETTTQTSQSIPSNKSTPSLAPHDLTSSDSCVKLGKRARKSETQLSMLRAALANDKLWSREKVEELSQTTGMTETQVYKWWWDQTRKRAKKLQKKHRQQQVLQQLKHQNSIEIVENKVSNSNNNNQPLESRSGTNDTQTEFQLPMMDEFGGYSSRLRMNHSQESFEVQELTSLLGIDVEQKAKQLVMQHRKSQKATSNSQLFNSRNNSY